MEVELGLSVPPAASACMIISKNAVLIKVEPHSLANLLLMNARDLLLNRAGPSQASGQNAQSSIPKYEGIGLADIGPITQQGQAGPGNKATVMRNSGQFSIGQTSNGQSGSFSIIQFI